MSFSVSLKPSRTLARNTMRLRDAEIRPSASAIAQSRPSTKKITSPPPAAGCTAITIRARIPATIGAGIAMMMRQNTKWVPKNGSSHTSTRA